MVKVLLTGHSRGLGAASLELMLTRGWHVWGVSRRSHPKAAKLAGQYPGRFQESAIDLSNLTALEGFLASASFQEFWAGATTAVLINNAGLLSPVARVGDQSNAEIIQSVMANVGAVLVLTNAFVAATAGCQDRRIIQVSSGAARSPYVGWSVYCATKAALDHHARCLSLEQPDHLRVVSLAPGVIDTDMQAQVRAAELAQFPMRAKFEQLKTSGALAQPQQVAQTMINFLMSDQFGAEPCADLRQL